MSKFKNLDWQLFVKNKKNPLKSSQTNQIRQEKQAKKHYRLMSFSVKPRHLKKIFFGKQISAQYYPKISKSRDDFREVETSTRASN